MDTMPNVGHGHCFDGDVMIIDSYPVVRVALADLVGSLGKCRFFEHGSVDEAIAQLKVANLTVGLVIIGIHEFDLTDGPRIAQVAALSRGSRMIILTASNDPIYTSCFLSWGVHGVVAMRRSVADVLSVICQVVGEHLFDGDLMALPIVRQADRHGAFNFLRLFSAREREIAALLAKGYPLRKISCRLNIAYSTAATYKDRILKKACVTNVAQLIRLVTAVGVN